MKETEPMDFNTLVSAIQRVHDNCAIQATKAVNATLTLRNWIIGCYICEYEQNGLDRAVYGEKLLERLAEKIQQHGLRRSDARELRRYRHLYLTYPQIWETVTPELHLLFPLMLGKREEIWETVSPEFVTDGKVLLNHLSFSHLAELMVLDDSLKRVFYEVECIRGQWSVRELRRQISSLLFERTGMSQDKAKLVEHVRLNAETMTPALAIRDPYVFEFLGIMSSAVMGESELEDLLLEKVQNFLLELGRGFCFEARQKRILIGDEFFFVDLVFYHRILKCHVLIELKVDEFKHEYLGQLNTYVNWFRKNEMTTGDNLPVGLLLCTRKNHALMEYALAGMDNQLFVSRYQMELPRKEELEQFIERELQEHT
jgi:predicted nuclease of restriction endonuclease-like (RecB) superfamily